MRGLPTTYWYLWTGMLVNRLGAFVFTFLAIYLTQVRGYSVAQAGLMVSLYGAGQIAAGPLGGVMADRLGRRVTMLLSSVLGAAAMVQLGLARSPEHIAISTLLLGFVGDLYRPAVQATIADVVAPLDRPRAFGYLYWAVNLGFSASTVIAGLMARHNFLLLFFGDAFTTLLFSLVVYLRVPETRPTTVTRVPRHPLTPLGDRRFLAFIAIQLLVVLVFMQGWVALPLDLRAHGIAPDRFGQLIALNGVMIVLLQPFAVRLVARRSRAHMAALGALLTGIGFGLTGVLTGSLVTAVLSIAVWTFGEIVFSSVVPTVIADLSPPELRGSYQGVNQMIWGIAGCCSPVIGSWVLGQFGGRVLWSACFVVGAIAALLHLTLRVHARTS